MQVLRVQNDNATFGSTYRIPLVEQNISSAKREALKKIITQGGFEMPDVKISVYKNRRGRWKGVYLWAKAERGICRINPMFVTKWNYELIEMEDLRIKIADESEF